MSVGRRRRVFFDMVKRRGMNPSRASTVALALHPLDRISRAKVPDAFKREVLERAARFDRESGTLSAEDSERMALAAIADYCELARRYGAEYYIDRFCGADGEESASGGDDLDRDAMRSVARGWGLLAEEYSDRYGDELDYTLEERRMLGQVAELATAPLPVLDLGCGPGHISRHLASLGLRVRGIDLAPEMIEVARRDAPEIDFEVADMLDLRLEPESLAGVVAMYSLIHLVRGDVAPVLTRLAEATVEGGPIFVAVHSGEGTARSPETLGKPVEMAATLYGEDEMVGYLREAGYSIVEAMTRAPYPEEFPSERINILAVRA